jgi:inner membrane transporter RhtA
MPPWLLVLIAAASVQFGAALARTLFLVLGPSGTVMLRVGSAVVILGLSHRPSICHLSKGQWGWIVAFGLSLAAMNYSFYQAFARIPLGLAVTIEFIGPLALALFGSRRALDVLWALLAVGGILLLGGDLSGGNLPGLLFALSAGFWWAVYILVNRRVGQQMPASVGLTLAMVVAAVLLLPLGAVQAWPAFHHPSLLLLGIGVGVLSSALPYSLEMEALRHLPPNVFGVLMSSEPALAALAGFAILGQHLSGRQLLAIAMVIFASAGASAEQKPVPSVAPLEAGP